MEAKLGARWRGAVDPPSARIAQVPRQRHVPARYKIVRQLGAVWEAEDTHLARRVALKFVRADFLHDARVLARLRHPNVLTVHDVCASEDELCLVLELVIGLDARTWRATRRRCAREVRAVRRAAASGLAALHRAGLAHHTLRPENVFVADDGRVLVGGFGDAASPRARWTFAIAATVLAAATAGAVLAWA